jgi:hypothetical protein
MNNIASTSANDQPPAILHLPDAIKQSETGNVVYHARSSSWSNRESLEAHVMEGRAIIRAMEGATLLDVVVKGVEPGLIGDHRRRLKRAIAAARRHKAILVAWDVSRFIRPQAYYDGDLEAKPTPAEYAALFTMADGVILATIQPPDLTEHGRHSQAIRRGGLQGRPSSIGVKLSRKIIALRGQGESFAKIAAMCGVSPTAVRRHLKAHRN